MEARGLANGSKGLANRSEGLEAGLAQAPLKKVSGWAGRARLIEVRVWVPGAA